jgi:hypothetical protein
MLSLVVELRKEALIESVTARVKWQSGQKTCGCHVVDEGGQAQNRFGSSVPVARWLTPEKFIVPANLQDAP